MVIYRHRQFGTTLIFALGIGALLCLASFAFFSPQGHTPFVVAFILLVSGTLFSSLLIEVTETHLRWSFGPGIIRRRVLLADIASAEVARTKFIEGWGIHRTARGWLYNVSGFQAVLVTLKMGKRFLLGTDEPERLVSVLREQSRRS